jgi:hypothetical protein
MCSEVMLHSVRKFHCTFHGVTVSCTSGICKVSTLLDLFGHLQARCILKKVLAEESVNKVDARLGLNFLAKLEELIHLILVLLPFDL